MNIKEHLSESLKLSSAPTPVPRMILCTLNVTLPLILGLYRNEHQSSIYGALMGFILILNDHFGPLITRLKHLITAFFLIGLSFTLGLLSLENYYVIFPVIFFMSFLVGKSKGQGVELERMMVFMTFQFLNASLTPGQSEHLAPLLMYAGISFVNYLICLSLVYLVMKHKPNFQKSKREILRKVISKNDSHRFALTLAGAACIGLIIGNYFQLSKANWIVATIIVIMMPSREESYQKTFQRAFGTVIGVFISLLVTHHASSPLVLIGFSALTAFLTPLGLIKSYWLGNVVTGCLIMFFMQIASFEHHAEVHLATLRLMDIGIGCVIGAVATFIAFPPGKK